MEKDYLEKLHEAELEILCAVDKFCTGKGIRYSLAYGTLLGAVRHKGFIPWDDDIDLMMQRKDYDRFITEWRADPPKGFLLQNDETDPDYRNNFLKIRKEHTTFIQSEIEKSVEYHTGIFIDVFPVDRVAPAGIKRTMQAAACMVNMLLTRNHHSDSRGIAHFAESVVLALPARAKSALKGKTYQYKIKWDTGHEELPLFWNGTPYGMHAYFDPDLFDRFTLLEFEGKRFQCIAIYERHLAKYFGDDYMELPPEDKRVTHHPLIIDFDKDYKEIQESHA